MKQCVKILKKYQPFEEFISDSEPDIFDAKKIYDKVCSDNNNWFKSPVCYWYYNKNYCVGRNVPVKSFDNSRHIFGWRSLTLFQPGGYEIDSHCHSAVSMLLPGLLWFCRENRVNRYWINDLQYALCLNHFLVPVGLLWSRFKPFKKWKVSGREKSAAPYFGLQTVQRCKLFNIMLF